MRKLVLGLLAIAVAFPIAADAQVRVRGHFRSNGTYVQPYYRSAPNSSVYDNYSTRGNVNPYTGQVGARDPYATPRTNYYSSPNSYFATPYSQQPKATRQPCIYYCPD